MEVFNGILAFIRWGFYLKHGVDEGVEGFNVIILYIWRVLMVYKYTYGGF
jgi:hypothetical protein